MKTIALTLMMLATSCPLWAQQLVVDSYQEKLRAGIAGPPVASLNRGASMEVLDQNGEWLKVRIEGWVRKGRLKTVDLAKSVADRALHEVNPGKLLLPRLVKKGYSGESFNPMIWLDVDFDTSQLPKTTRAIKGALIISDLFGDPMMRIYWTINEPLTPGQDYSEKGTNFAYNEFLSHHQWVRFTDIEDMQVSFEVSDIIYQDGDQAAWYR
jgi:hypothetical protein